MNSKDQTSMNEPALTRFIAMAATYCLGVFNDNYFKQAAMLIAVSAGLSRLQGTATMLFAMPFILCSSYAGWLADRFPKRKVVIGSKGVELAAMLVGAVGILYENWSCILGMVFLMGLQSAFFSPALNGSIPELYPGRQVPKANAALKLTTTLAILAGIAAAGVSLDQNWFDTGSMAFGKVLIASMVVTVSGLGLLMSFGTYSLPTRGPKKAFPWLGPINSLRDVYSTRQDRQLLLAVVADAYFYFIASITVLTINTLGLGQLDFSRSITSMLPVCLMVGVCIGSLLAARITAIDTWFRSLGPAGLGMATGLFLCGLTPFLPRMLHLAWLTVFLTITGISGGLFLIPVTSFLQVRPAASDKGRILAAANFSSFCGILLSGSIFSLLVSHISAASIMSCLGAFGLVAAVAFAMMTTKKQGRMLAVLHHLVKWVLGLRYAVEVKGLNGIAMKNDKGILFLPNHPALIDPVICMSILYPRYRPRPLVDKDQGNKLPVKWLLNPFRPIFIPDLQKNGRDSRKGIEGALQEVISGLKEGENIIFYPAGRLYRSAREDLGGNSGVESVIRQVKDLQVVLVRITGLWGSSFSFARGVPPSPFKYAKKYIAALIVNGLVWGQRRRITVEFIEDETLAALPDRLAINGHLEKYYNAISETNTMVPYFWWQGKSPKLIVEPERKIITGDAGTVPVVIRERVTAKLEELAGVAGIKDDDRLGRDLAIDSISLMELTVWLENEFGIAPDDMDSLVSVNDCILAASGQVFDKKQARLKPVAEKWFSGSAERTLTFPKTDTITAAFLSQAKTRPNEIVLADQISGPKTYRDILTGIHVLKPIIEKIKKERIGIMLPATVNSGIVFLTCLFGGKTPVMLNWTAGIRHLRHCLEKVGVRHVITAKALYLKLTNQGLDLASLDIDWLFLDEIATTIGWRQKISAVLKARVMHSLPARQTVGGPAVILFTSGSEAEPKAVPLSHANIMANMHDFASIMSIMGNDRLLAMLPPFHSLGLVGTIILPLCLGLKTVYHANPTESVTLARLIDHYRTSMLISTPTFLAGILNAATDEQLTSLKLVFTGAEKCPALVYQSFRSLCPKAVLCEGYGITECSPLVCVNRPENPKTGTIGKMLPSMEYAIIDPEENQPVAKGKQGILLVRGPNIFSGYLNDTTATGFYLFAGKTWYHTGDFVKEDDEGTLIFCGRQKRFVKLGGEMVSLPAIEAALQEQFSGSEDNGPLFAVEATSREDHPEIVLFTPLRMGREDANRFIKKAGLSPLHNIQRIENIESIPVLGTGKTDYKQLKEKLAA